MNTLSRAAIAAQNSGLRSLGETPEGWIRVTKPRSSFVWEALSAITHDGGGGADHPWYNVPPGWFGRLPEIEHAISFCTEEQRETLAIGECTEVDALVKNVVGLPLAYEFFNAFFEDFIDHEVPTNG